MVPERTCVGCHAKRPKGELIRLARGAGGVGLDAAARLPGRGAYVCDDPRCWHAGITKRRLDRALRTSLPTATPLAMLDALRARARHDRG